MLKFRCAALCNIGWKDAFFESETLRCTDVRTGAPIDAVWHAINGSGKTSALALIFSTFDTPVNRFMRTLAKPAEKFEHYFNDEPACIAVEWTADGKDRRVTAQIVARRSDGALDRFFVAFRGDAKFGFESLPFAGLAASRDTRLRTRDDVLRWLRETEMARRDTHEFTKYEKQLDWHARLEREGIDPQLIAWMVDLNKQEGGIGKFIEFQNEFAFIERFLEMVLDASHCAEVHQQIREGIKHLAEVIASRDKLEAVRAIEAKLRPLVGAAAVLEIARTEAEEAASREAGFLIAIEEDKAHTEATQERAAAEEKKRGEQQKAAAQRLRIHKVDAEVASAAMAVSIRCGAEAHLESSRRSRDKMKTEAAALEAALSWRAVLVADREIERIGAQIAEAAKGLEGPKAQAQQAGDTLAVVLSRLIAEASEGIERERLTASAARQRRQQAEAGRYQNADAASKLRTEDGSVKARVAAVEKDRRMLVADGILWEDETGEAALVRLAEEIERADAERKAAVQAAAAAEAARTQWDGIAGEKGAEAALIVAEKARDEKMLAEARRERAAICAENVILDAVGDLFDPESPSVVLALNQKAARSKVEARSIEGRVAAIHADQSSVARHGIAAIDTNAERVIEHLRDNGIVDAMPFPVWKMHQGASPGVLRELAATDPARFTGVAVTGTDDILIRARELASVARLGLTRPVAVFDGNGPVGAAAVETVVFAVERDAAYDSEAAARLLADAARQSVELSEQLQAKLARVECLEQQRRRIEDWVAKWGRGRLRELIDAIEKSQTALDEARRQEAAGRERGADARKEAETRRGQALNAAERATKLREFLARGRHYREAEATLPGLRGREREIAALIRMADEAEFRFTAEIADASAAERKADEVVRELRREKGGLETEFGTIRHRSGEPADNSSSREVASSAYRVASNTYEELERDRLGSVAARRDEKQDARERLVAAFHRLHGSMTDTVKTLAAEDGLDARLAAARSDVAEWTEKVGKAATMLEVTRSEEEKWKNKLSSDDFDRAEKLSQSEDMEALSARHDEAERAAASDAEDEDRHKGAATAAKERKLELSRRLSTLKTMAGMVKPRPGVVAIPVSLEVDEDLLREQAATLAERAKEKERKVQAAERAAGQLARAAIREASALGREALLGIFAREIAALDENAIIEAAGSLLEGAVQTIQSYETDLRTHEAKEELIVTALVNVARKGIDALNATEGVAVPQAVPRFGGYSILRKRANFSRLREDHRRDICKAWLEAQVRLDRIPAKGHLIVAEIIGKYREALGGTTLGIEILKPTDAGEIGYMPIGETRASGGEGLTASLFLWLVLVRQRAKTKADARSAIGGALFLDNPLGTANHQLFLRSQRALAKAMGIQLIFTTGINDLNALGEFPHVLKFGKVATRGTRILVKVAHETIGEPDLPTDEAAA